MVICQIPRSHRTKIAHFDLNWALLDCNSSLNAGSQIMFLASGLYSWVSGHHDQSTRHRPSRLHCFTASAGVLGEYPASGGLASVNRASFSNGNMADLRGGMAVKPASNDVTSFFHFLNVIMLVTSTVSKYLMNKKSQICVKCVIWKQIHEKWESVITESWTTFSNGRVRYWAGPSYQPPSATEWPHYIMTNWPQVVPQKAHTGRCGDKQKSFDLNFNFNFKKFIWYNLMVTRTYQYTSYM